MYELQYVGNSPYGVSIYLIDGRSIVTVSQQTPFKLGSELTDREIRYYKSLVKCDVILVEPPVIEVVEDAVEEVIVDEFIIEEVVEDVVEELVVEEPVVEEEVNIQAIYDKFIDELTDDDVDKLCDDLDFSTRKRNKGKKLWELLNSDVSDKAIQILLNR